MLHACVKCYTCVHVTPFCLLVSCGRFSTYVRTYTQVHTPKALIYSFCQASSVTSDSTVAQSISSPRTAVWNSDIFCICCHHKCCENNMCMVQLFLFVDSNHLSIETRTQSCAHIRKQTTIAKKRLQPKHELNQQNHTHMNLHHQMHTVTYLAYFGYLSFHRCPVDFVAVLHVFVFVCARACISRSCWCTSFTVVKGEVCVKAWTGALIKDMCLHGRFATKKD